MNDIRSALRQWRRAPLVTVVAGLSLTCGIAANLALFSLVDALLLKTLPIASPDTLTRVVSEVRPGEQRDVGVATHVWEHIRDHQTMFASVLAVGVDRVNLARGGEARYVGCAFVDAGYFDTLGLTVLRGRPFHAGDNQADNAAVAVISYSLWQREFGGGDVIGQPLYLDNHRFEIIGVAPRDFFGLEVGRADDVMVPLAAQDIIRGAISQLRVPEASWLQIYGRLPDPQQFEQARAALRAWYPALREATLLPGVAPARHLSSPLDLATASQGRSIIRGQYGNALNVLLAAVGVLLLIASVNLAVLATARFSDRRHEIGVRLSLGASRARVARLLLTDSLLLATVSGGAGLWLGQVVARSVTPYLSISRFAATNTQLPTEIDYRLIALAVVLSLVSALVAGLAPAWFAARTSPLETMNEQTRGSHGRRTLFTMRALAAGQVTLSVILVVGASLLVRSFLQLTTRQTGVEAERVLVAVVNDPMRSNTLVGMLQRIERTRAALATVPGVEGVSAGIVTPLSGLMAAAAVQVPGSLAPPTSGYAPFNSVLPGYFDVLGTPILIGRDFNEMDVAGGVNGGRRVAIVNQAFAQQHFGDYNPIGRRLVVGDREVEIVGVVANARAMSLREDRDVAMAYAPIAQRTTLSSANLRWVIRAQDPERLRHGVLLAFRALDPLIAVEFRTMSDDALATVNRERLLAWLGGMFASLGLLMAIVGIYGTFAYSVIRRRIEIGVRLALGAQRRDVFALLAREAAVVIGVGTAAGIAGALASTQLIQSLLFDLSARDVETIALACTAILIAAAVATYIPARRAALLDPATTLRE